MVPCMVRGNKYSGLDSLWELGGTCSRTLVDMQVTSRILVCFNWKYQQSLTACSVFVDGNTNILHTYQDISLLAVHV